MSARTLSVPNFHTRKMESTRLHARFGDVAVTAGLMPEVRYAITHAPTGCKLADAHFLTLKAAKACAKELAAAKDIDWPALAKATAWVRENPFDTTSEVARRWYDDPLNRRCRVAIDRIVQEHSDREDESAEVARG